MKDLTKKTYKDEEQQLKKAVLKYIQFFPRKGFAWSQYNGGVYDPHRGHYRKKSKYARNGVPDIIGIWCRKPLFMEIKTLKGVVSPEQKEFLEQAEAHGAIAFVCRDICTAIQVLNSFDHDSCGA